MPVPGILGVIASLVVLASGANAEDQDLTALGGSKAIQAIIGSTITLVGVPDGPVSMYVGSDQTYDYVKNGEISSEKWFEKNHLFCIKSWDCSSIVVSGAQGYLIDVDSGNAISFTIEPGNHVDDSAAK